RVPKPCLRRLLVERFVDVGSEERLDRWCERLELTGPRLERTRQRQLERVYESERFLAHRHDQLRLDDVELAPEPGAAFVVLAIGELEAVRAVHGKRVHPEARQRLLD